MARNRIVYFIIFCGTVSSVEAAPGTVVRRGLAYLQGAQIERSAGERVGVFGYVNSLHVLCVFGIELPHIDEDVVIERDATPVLLRGLAVLGE